MTMSKGRSRAKKNFSRPACSVEFFYNRRYIKRLHIKFFINISAIQTHHKIKKMQFCNIFLLITLTAGDLAMINRLGNTVEVFQLKRFGLNSSKFDMTDSLALKLFKSLKTRSSVGHFVNKRRLSSTKRRSYGNRRVRHLKSA